MPPPVDCCQFPIARFLHLDETTGPSPQHTLAEEREVVETGAEREVAPLSMGEDSSSGVPTQGLPLTGDRIKLVQQNMAECQKFLSVSIFLVEYLSLRLASQLMCPIGCRNLLSMRLQSSRSWKGSKLSRAKRTSS